MNENKKLFCDSLCATLRLTSAAGSGNALTELRYMKLDNGDEIVRPVFEDGTGENGYYDINVSGDSCIGILCDVMQFVKRMW